MLEGFFILLAVLLPLIIPIAVIVLIVRARRTKRVLESHDSALAAIRDDIRRMNAHVRSVEKKVGELRIAAGDVARVSGEAEMGAPARRALKPAVKAKEKVLEKPAEPAKTVRPEKPPAAAITPKGRIGPDLGGIRPAETRAGVTKPKAAPAEPSGPIAEPTSWDRLASRFLANWTGILGSVVLVAGIGFLGTYAALRMQPFARFILVLVASAALYAGYLSLRERERWQAMALWLRSSAAAVFLFACAAAGGLPNAGLMWIESAAPALALLLAGVAVNLSLAWAVGSQGFATLHVVLSLIPMAILPQAPMALGIVTAIAVFGVLLAQQRQWTYHLMATMLIYAVFHIFWVIKQSAPLPLPARLPALAVGSAALVYLGSALTCYRRIYAQRRQDSDTIIAHLVSWGLLAAAIVLHLQRVEVFGTAMLGPALLASGLLAFGLSFNAKRREIKWLRDADILIAQALVLGSLLTWRSLLGPPIIFNAVIYLETLLFLRLVIDDGVRPAAMIGALASAAAAVLLILAGIWTFGSLGEDVGVWQLAALMFAAGCVTTLSGAYLSRNYRQEMTQLTGPNSLSVVGPLTGMMVFVALASLYTQLEFGIFALAMVGTLYYTARQLPNLGLIWGVWLTIVTTHVIAWILSFGGYAEMPPQQLAQLVPAAALAVLAIWHTPSDRGTDEQRQLAISLLGINLGISAYLLLGPVSALMPTVAWLLMSLVALEAANRLRSKATAVPVLSLGYLYVLAAAIGYMTVVMPTLTYLYSINLRLVMEVFGMAVILYWWMTRPSDALADTASWRAVHPYFLELTLALLATTVFIEVPLVWRPVAWMAIAFLFLTPQLTQLASRFIFYSLAAFITSVLAVTVNVSIAAVPSPIWYQQPWYAGLIAVVIQCMYLLLAYRRLELEKVSFQRGLYRLEYLSQVLSADRAATTCYPFFAGLALFLAWRFEQALLTFLWASETFAIFVLSIVLRQNHFRLVALAGLAACLLRLVVYDMREADLFIRGLVFVGVGILMLAMNAVYNKYGARVR